VGRLPGVKNERRGGPATGRWLQHLWNRSRSDMCRAAPMELDPCFASTAI